MIRRKVQSTIALKTLRIHGQELFVSDAVNLCYSNDGGGVNTRARSVGVHAIGNRIACELFNARTNDNMEYIHVEIHIR